MEVSANVSPVQIPLHLWQPKNPLLAIQKVFPWQPTQDAAAEPYMIPLTVHWTNRVTDVRDIHPMQPNHLGQFYDPPATRAAEDALADSKFSALRNHRFKDNYAAPEHKSPAVKRHPHGSGRILTHEDFPSACEGDRANDSGCQGSSPGPPLEATSPSTSQTQDEQTIPSQSQPSTDIQNIIPTDTRSINRDDPDYIFNIRTSCVTDRHSRGAVIFDFKNPTTKNAHGNNLPVGGYVQGIFVDSKEQVRVLDTPGISFSSSNMVPKPRKEARSGDINAVGSIGVDEHVGFTATLWSRWMSDVENCWRPNGTMLGWDQEGKTVVHGSWYLEIAVGEGCFKKGPVRSA